MGRPARRDVDGRPSPRAAGVPQPARRAGAPLDPAEFAEARDHRLGADPGRLRLGQPRSRGEALLRPLVSTPPQPDARLDHLPEDGRHGADRLRISLTRAAQRAPTRYTCGRPALSFRVMLTRLASAI